MKKITIFALTALAASVLGSCCCQDQGAPPLTKLPKFDDLDQPGTEMTGAGPRVMDSKK